ncbi:ArsA family ATPase [Anaerocolumna chitinilytica]|uniref:arsenite-transporting ATPase n=1 Tax=Anaerocolumna chitinilytica TaxID=1727145 RepID=A0A7I8DJC9_9FIRM|nr:ArsA family ATPase [Anaerocolumna chitinilytica]BCJ98608.1 arsenic-transporting ATPase [Anaerocolumna chitinilytica]
MTRMLIFTGKGGVGKTSVAAAHARNSSNEGKKTLIVSTDMAHSLNDIFDLRIGKTIQKVSDNLYALEIDPSYVMEEDFADMKQALIKVIESSGIPIGNIGELSIFPGMDELFSLLKLKEIYASGEYDRIIVDCAPTGETLALLKFPELLAWYMEKFFPIGKVAMKILAPISKTVFKIQLPDSDAMTDIERLYRKLIELQEFLKDRKTTSIRIVTMPEKMVVEETKRNFMYMNLYDYHVDGIYINRILPKDMDNPFFIDWIAIQNQYIEELEAVFDGMPIYKIPWFDTDLNGLSGVDRIEQNVLKGRDVFSIQEELVSQCFEKVENGYNLLLKLPFIEKGEVILHESGTDIILKIGNFKRCIPKPNSLRNYAVTGAQLSDGILTVNFTEGGIRE